MDKGLSPVIEIEVVSDLAVNTAIKKGIGGQVVNKVDKLIESASVSPQHQIQLASLGAI